MDTIFSKINQGKIKQYQKHLEELKLSEATIKRRLSSIRRFCEWSYDEGYLKENPFITQKLTEKIQKIQLPLTSGLVRAYEIYQSISITKYLHYAILIIFCAALGFGAYDQFFRKAPEPLAYPAATAPVVPNRYLSFQGRLTDSSDNPISSSTSFRFALYNSATASGSAQLWEEQRAITPDQDGIFSVILGTNVAIPTTVFTDNASIWLGVTVNQDPGMTPRQQIATVGYALNAETLQGIPPSASPSANKIPIITQSGDLVLAGASPRVYSTSGTFGIKGQALSITTDTGTNGNIAVAPDGTGKLNINLGGASGNQMRVTDANITSGSLVSAYAGTNSTGFDLLNLSSGDPETEKFAVDYSGDVSLAGGGITGANSVSINIGETSSSYVISSAGFAVGNGTTFYFASTGNLNANTGTFAGDLTVDTNDLFVDISENKIGMGTATLTERLTLSGNATISGTLALGPNIPGYAGTCDASAKGKQYYNGVNNTMYYCNGSSWTSMTGGGTVGGSGTANRVAKFTDTYTIGNSGINDLSDALAITIDSSENVGIGTTSPTAKLDIAGSASSSGTLAFRGTTDPKIDILNGENFGIRTSVGGDTGLSERLTVLNNGNVGIGTTAPATNSKLDVRGQVAGQSWLQLWNTGSVGTLAGGDARAAVILGANNTAQGWFIGPTVDATAANMDLGFYKWGGINNWSMVLDKSGNVGIGTTSPTALLDISGATGATTSGILTFRGTTDPSINVLNGENLTFKTSVGGDTGLTTKMTLSPAGKLTLSGDLQLNNNQILNSAGTAAINFSLTPSTSYNTLDAGNWLVSNTANLGQAALMINQTMGGDIFTASASGTPKFVISNAGNVGIGTTGPTNGLEVYSASSYYAAKFSRSGSVSLYTYADSAGSGITPAESSRNLIYLVPNSRIAFYGNSQEVMRITDGGYVGIGTTGPNRKLEISGDAGTYPGIRLSYNGSPTNYYGEWVQWYIGAAQGFGYQFNIKDGDLATDLTAMTIRPSGNVGIGTTSPLGDAGDLTLGSAAGTQGTLYLYGSTAGVYSRIQTTNGNLHIDAAAGAYPMYLNYYTGTGGIVFGNGATGTNANVSAAGVYTGTSLNVGSGAITSGLINGQTITSAASFTGTLTTAGLINATNYLQINSKYAIDGTDSYLRLNQQNSFTSGIYTPYVLRADGIIYSADSFRQGAGTSVNTIMDSNQFYCNNAGNCHFNYSGTGLTYVGNAAGVSIPGNLTVSGTTITATSATATVLDLECTNCIDQADIGANAVHRGEIANATEEDSGSGTPLTVICNAGAGWCFFPRAYGTVASGCLFPYQATSTTSYRTYAGIYRNDGTCYVLWSYITTSPPYFIDGYLIKTFIYFLWNKETGQLVQGHKASDPPWENGSTMEETPHPFFDYLGKELPEPFEIAFIDPEDLEIWEKEKEAMGAQSLLELFHTWYEIDPQEYTPPISLETGKPITIPPGTVWRRLRKLSVRRSVEEGGTPVGGVVEVLPKGGGDVAEGFETLGKFLEPGDIIVPHQTYAGAIDKSTTPYQKEIIGIVSTRPSLNLDGYEDPITSLTKKKAPVAVNGTVPTKVSTINGPIMVGDPITTSEIPGVGMKATKAGPIVGKALEAFDNPNPNVVGKIMVFVNISWYDPDVFLTDSGDLKITRIDTNENTNKNEYSLVDSVGNTISRVGAFAQIAVAELRAGLIESTQIITDTLSSTQIHTDIISPLPDSSDVTIQLGNKNATESAFGKLLVQNAQGETVASIDEAGNATFAGTLYVDEIVARKGTFGELLAATVSASQIAAADLTEIQTRLAKLEDERTQIEQISTDITDPLNSSPSAESVLLAEAESWPISDVSQDLRITSNLKVLGRTSLADTSIAGSLNVDGTLVIADSSINSLSGTLYLQNLGLGGVDILAGKVVITQSGDVSIQGNLAVGGEISASALTLDSRPSTLDSGFGKLLEIKNPAGEIVASIDSSGSAQFAQIETKKIVIANNSEQSTVNSEQSANFETNATAGKATLPAGETELQITNYSITNNSLIYLTPVSGTQNKVLYVKAKKGGNTLPPPSMFP